MTDELDYPRLMRDALLGVIRAALRRAADEGLPGDHHFYISFHTDAPGVSMPAKLRAMHPSEMTIVLQNQYWNLVVEEHSFAVTLRFGGAPTRLEVPLAAVTAFVDPSVEFGLRLTPGEDEAEQASPDEAAEPDARPTPEPGKVVPFRPQGEGGES